MARDTCHFPVIAGSFLASTQAFPTRLSISTHIADSSFGGGAGKLGVSSLLGIVIQLKSQFSTILARRVAMAHLTRLCLSINRGDGGLLIDGDYKMRPSW